MQGEADVELDDLETWAEDRLRLVEHLASESRESTAEIRSSIQEALHLGEASERRTLGAVAEESRNRDLTLQREQQIREDDAVEEGARPAGRRMKGRGGEEDDRYAGKAGKFERLDDDDAWGPSHSVGDHVEPVLLTAPPELPGGEAPVWLGRGEAGDLRQLQEKLGAEDGVLAAFVCWVMSAMDAYFSGSKVDLCVKEIGEMVIAAPVDPVFGFLTFRCQFPTWVVDHMQIGTSFTVLDFKVQGEGEEVCLSGKAGVLLPILHPRTHDHRVAEAFAGLGGWSHGAMWNGTEVAMMVEKDQCTAETCARNHAVHVLRVDEAIDAIKGQCLPKSFVLLADITDPMVYVIAGFVGIATWLASPPCQPWSKASWQRGLDDEDGAVFGKFLFLAGASKAKCLNLENVPGLPEHPHYGILRKIMSMAGYHLVFANCDKVMPVLPIMRVRWLATCVRKDVHFSDAKLAMAQAVALPKSVHGVGEINSIGSFGAVQFDLQNWEVRQCVPDAAVLQILSDPRFLPPNLRKEGYLRLSGREILQLRMKYPNQPLPNVMATQGSQHELPSELLAEKGLFSFLLNVNECLRFATPFEIASAMGFPSTTSFPDDFHTAWKMIGNALSVPHAALQCLRSWILLGELSGFSGDLKSGQDISQAVSQRKCVLKEFVVQQEHGIMKLTPKTHPVLVMPTEVIESSDEEHEDGLDDGSRKRACVSPTWHCQHDEPTLIPELNRQDCPELAAMTVGTKTVQCGMPFFYEIQQNVHGLSDEQVHVKLLHTQGIWSAAFVTPKRWSVKQIFQSILAHANQEHFEHIEVNGSKAWFGSTPIGVSGMNIFFKPFCFARTVVTRFMQLGLAVEVDVTWKFSDLIAYIATEAAVLPSGLQIIADERIMMSSEYVLSTQVMHFQAVLKTHDIEIPRPITEPEIVHVDAAVHTDEGGLFHPGLLRFTVRNPKWGTIRSCVVTQNSSAKDVMDKLLPGFLPDTSPQFCHNGSLIKHDTPVKELPREGLAIFFPTAKPWPVADVVVSTFSIKSAFNVEGKEVIKIWVKGPFDFRAHHMSLPIDETLLQIASRFLADAKCDLSLLVMQNGKGIDPRQLVGQTNSETTVEFRACALPGGAKGNPKVNEANAKKLRTMLAQRGVPEAALAARAALIVGTVDSAELSTILTKEDKQAWGELKIKANQAKIRMITSMELKDHQKAQRKKAAEGTLPKKEGEKPNRNKPAGKNDEPLKKVYIDPKHFTCPAGKLNIIDLAQWGPDQNGIAIATMAEALKMMPVNKISPDALALVVLTREPFAGHSPIALPAVEINGRPVLTSAVVLNFGDVEVSCQPNLPKVDLQETPTATLEVFILRELVNQWQDVQNPLNYLGLQLPEIRKGQVIASWNFRTYDAARQKCRHDQGTYVHGFVKIPEELLAATLVRSGHAGVFLQVKADNRKPDPRFGVVAMHGMPLEEVVKLAQCLKNVLGVVQLGQNGVFALRARREHIQEIRRNALPQGISMQEGVIPSGANWWVLRLLTVSTTCEAITTALHELGWEATAIRPSGKSAWLVCSSADPPATHLCIGQEYVAVMPAKSQTTTKVPAAPMVPFQHGADFSEDANAVGESATPTTVTSRIDTIRTDLRTDLEEKLTNLIQDRMRECDLKVNELAATVQNVQMEIQDVSSVVEDMKTETKEEFTAIRSDIASGNSCIMNQMQNLFQKMQTEIQTTLTAAKEGQNETEAKRPRH
eukprot:s199_g6.t3